MRQKNRWCRRLCSYWSETIWLSFRGRYGGALPAAGPRPPLRPCRGTFCTPAGHPVQSGGTLRLAVSLDGAATHELSYHTHGRSEVWKLNVLANVAVCRLRLPVTPQEKPHRLAVKALDDGVVLDQVRVYAVE